MSQSQSLTNFATPLSTYSELAEVLRGFSRGHLDLVFLLGRPGVGKTQSMRAAAPSNSYWVDGTASAFGIYMEAYRAQDLPLILDDVDGLHSNPQGVRLLKSLCQTDPCKSVSWLTANPILAREEIPNRFDTTSSVAIIANHWKISNPDVAALLNRGHVFEFNPSALEVHRQAQRWFWDQTVFDFVAENLHLLEDHSFRTYVLASQRRQAGLDWRGYVLSQSLSGTTLEVARIKADPQYDTEKARVRAFTSAGHGSRATWFRHARKIERPSEGVPRLRLARDSRHSTTPDSHDGQLFGDSGDGHPVRDLVI